MFRYFFSYHADVAGDGCGFGNIVLTLAKPIRGTSDLDWVAESVRINRPGTTTVVILSWQKIEED